MAWYYALHGIRKGPVAEPDFDALVQGGELPPDTLVWQPGMADWVALHTVVPGMEITQPVQPVAPRAPHLLAIRSRIKDATTSSVPTLPRSTTARITTVAVPGGPQETPFPMEFTGSSSEYFRIWFVNTLFTVLTCGIFSAWARVRTQEYFARNTCLDGQPFEYNGNPWAILRGYLIVAAGIGLTALSFYLDNNLGLAMVVACILSIPWLIWKCHSCRVSSTGFLGLPFHFHGSSAENYFIHVGLVLLVPLTGGLILPYIWYRRRKFFFGNLGYGNLRLHFETRVGWFYLLMLKIMALNLATILLAGLLVLPIAMFGRMPLDGEDIQAIFLGMVLVFSGICVPAYYSSRTFNHVLDNATIGPRIRVISNNLQARELLRLQIGNLVAIALTLGLAIPWAKVRVARYRITRICLLCQGGLVPIAYGAIPGNVPGANGGRAAQGKIQIGL